MAKPKLSSNSPQETKVCARCKLELPISRFVKKYQYDRKTKTNYDSGKRHSWCNLCRKYPKEAGKRFCYSCKTHVFQTDFLNPGERSCKKCKGEKKQCNVCRKSLLLSNFSTSTKHLSGLLPYCKNCFEKVNYRYCTECDRNILKSSFPTKNSKQFNASICFDCNLSIVFKTCPSCKRNLPFNQFKAYSRKDYSTNCLDCSLKQNQPESCVRDALAKQLDGQIEILTPIGKIDILTHDSIIEVKFIREWKQALGQLLAYSYFYPDKKLIVYFYSKGRTHRGQLLENSVSVHDIVLALKIFARYNIEVMLDE